MKEIHNTISHLRRAILDLADDIDENIRCRKCNEILSVYRLCFLPEPKLCPSCRLQPIKVHSHNRR